MAQPFPSLSLTHHTIPWSTHVGGWHPLLCAILTLKSLCAIVHRTEVSLATASPSISTATECNYCWVGYEESAAFVVPPEHSNPKTPSSHRRFAQAWEVCPAKLFVCVLCLAECLNCTGYAAVNDRLRLIENKVREAQSAFSWSRLEQLWGRPVVFMTKSRTLSLGVTFSVWLMCYSARICFVWFCGKIILCMSMIWLTGFVVLD